MSGSCQFVIVSPVRDEEKYLRLTIESVVRQTLKPAEWVIVNDGSQDATGAIADEAARENKWIHVVHRKNRGFRQAGAGVVETFYEGFNHLQPRPWEFLVKLDADLSFEPDYFSRCLDHMRSNPEVGIVGGTICVAASEREVVPEFPDDPAFHVRGATKIYRRGCWEAIGGLLRAPGWDTMDEVKANMLGWNTGTLPGVRLIQHRRTGGPVGTWKNYFKNGRGSYILGYHPAFMAVKCLRRAFHRPYIVIAAALLAGFAHGYIRRLQRVTDRQTMRYLRQQQLNRLLLRPSIWR